MNYRSFSVYLKSIIYTIYEEKKCLSQDFQLLLLRDQKHDRWQHFMGHYSD